MHPVSASSRVSVTQPESRLSWSNQLGKSVFLAASSVGLGWLISRLWKGTDEQPIGQAGSSGQLAVYCEKQKDAHWSNTGSFSMESSEVFEHGLQPESSFYKVGIVYKSSVQETVKSSALSGENSNYHVLSACSLVGGLLMGGNIQLPLMVPLLALSMSKSVEALNYVDDNPVGTIIAYASKELPEGYLRCDGSLHPKNEYPELYKAIGGKYGVDGESFRVPDFEGLFLRGTNDESEIGKKFEDTTRMPRNNPFKAKDSGVHVHTTHPSGQHDHTSDLAGEHSHAIDKAGLHRHTDQFENVLQRPAKDDKIPSTQLGPTGWDLPDVTFARPIKEDGEHVHHIQDSGSHSHGIHVSGVHRHSMDEAGSHVHEIVGGDPETSPKNSKVAYLIKAKRSENGSTAGTSTDGLITSQSVVLSLVTATFAFFAARMGR